MCMGRNSSSIKVEKHCVLRVVAGKTRPEASDTEELKWHRIWYIDAEASVTGTTQNLMQKKGPLDISC